MAREDFGVNRASQTTVPGAYWERIGDESPEVSTG